MERGAEMIGTTMDLPNGRSTRKINMKIRRSDTRARGTDSILRGKLLTSISHIRIRDASL